MKKGTALFLIAVLFVSTVLGLPGTVAATSKGSETAPYIIDFNKEGAQVGDYVVETNKDRKAKFSLFKTAGFNGAESIVLKIDGTVNPGVTTNLNQNQSLAGTPDSKTNPYFAGYNIKNNSYYRYSAWLKLDESVTEKPKNAVANLVFRYNKMNADGSAGTVRKSFAEKLYNNPGVWIQVVTYFKVSFAGETDNTKRPIALSLEFDYSLNGIVYLQSMEIAEIGEIKQFGDPQEVQTLTFDDDRPYEFERPGFTVALAPEKDGTATNALKLSAGTYKSDAVVNIRSTLYSQTDPAFAVPIKGNKSYKVTARAYLANGSANLAYAGLILAYKANSTTEVTRQDTDFHDALNNKRGQWVQLSATITPTLTNPNETAKLGVTFNFGKIVAADVYIDDITVTETQPLKYYDYNNPQAQESITFDDNRPYSFSLPCYAVTQSAPARNGKVTNALKLSAGTYKSDTVVNIGATLYSQTDPAFAVPVKPNQPYLITAWVYLSATTPQGQAAPNATAAYLYAAVSNEERNTYEITGALNAGKGRWVQVQHYVETGASVHRLGITFNFGKTVPADVFIDDIVIAETAKRTLYDGPKAEQIITFDDNRPYNFDKPQFEIVTSPHARDGVVSKVLKVKEGTYNNNAVINQNTTLNSQTDPAFAIPVVGGRTYKLSAYIFIESTNSAGQKPAGWTEVYLYGAEANNRNDKVFTATVNRKVGTWVKIENYIITQENTKKLGVSLNFAKNIYSNVYIDDIKLEDVGPIKLHTTPQDVTVITFEDGRPYSFELPDNMAIEDAPERDGKPTRALRIFAGEFNYNVCLNQSTLWQGNPGTDRVFTIPVLPNTLYKFSFYVYLMKNNRFTYCEVMGDTNTPSTILDLQGSGVNYKTGVWQKCEVFFLTGADQTKINTFFNLGKVAPDAYFDDFKLEAFRPGVFRQTGLTYCEEDFNLLYRQGISQKVNAAATGVYKLPVKPNTQYTFAVTAAGKNPQDKLFLSFNGSSPMLSVVEGVPNAVVTPIATEKRYSFDFVTNSSGFVYLVVQNPGGTLKLSSTQIFRTLSVATQLSLGAEQNPNLAASPVYTPTVYDYAVSGNPETGETPTAAVSLTVLFTAAAALLILRKGKGKRNE